MRPYPLWQSWKWQRGRGDDGGPPDGRGDFDPGGDNLDCLNNCCPLHRGYSMPPVDQARLHTSGICTTSEHYCTQMHDQLLHLFQEHLTIRLRIPEGTKVR